ncbi:MAG: UxaA family hydrolase [Promethearchaeota archaeon]|jgi:altronate dehydratase small subunit
MSNELRAIVINEKDNVATLISDVKAGNTVIVRMGDKEENMTVTQDIKFGHKFAIKPIAKGEDIIKYGEIIGRATIPISIGEHAHVHNIESLRGRGDIKEA